MELNFSSFGFTGLPLCQYQTALITIALYRTHQNISYIKASYLDLVLEMYLGYS